MTYEAHTLETVLGLVHGWTTSSQGELACPPVRLRRRQGAAAGCARRRRHWRHQPAVWVGVLAPAGHAEAVPHPLVLQGGVEALGCEQGAVDVAHAEVLQAAVAAAAGKCPVVSLGSRSKACPRKHGGICHGSRMSRAAWVVGPRRAPGVLSRAVQQGPRRAACLPASQRGRAGSLPAFPRPTCMTRASASGGSSSSLNSCWGSTGAGAQAEVSFRPALGPADPTALCVRLSTAVMRLCSFGSRHCVPSRRRHCTGGRV